MNVLLRFLVTCAALTAWPAGSALAEVVAGYTKPSQDVMLAFVRPGRVAKILVKQGQAVEAGALLAHQDDTAEQFMLAQLEVTAAVDDRIQIEYAQATLAQKEVDYQELVVAAERGGAAKLEVDHARLDVTIAKLSVELAESKHRINVLKCKEMAAQIERMRLVSPIVGKVEEILVEEGESPETGGQSIRVVNVDPLWIDLPVPLDQTRGLAVGGAARVEFPGTDRPAVEGRVIFVASVIVGEIRTVRIELPNKLQYPAGEPVIVRFAPQPAGDRAAAAPPKATAASRPASAAPAKNK